MPSRFDASDSPRSVGLVTAKTVELFSQAEPLQLESGETLAPVQVAYEMYGEPEPDGSNVVFVCHALTGDAHAAGWHREEDRKPGWWDGLIGPGKPIDTTRFAVVCANILGGCRGTTGPATIRVDSESQYGPDFPFITIGDIVSVHKRLCDHLGFDRVHAVLGGSLGGMQALEWAARFPTSSDCYVTLAAGPKLQAQGIAFNAVARRAIFADPRFRDGHYYGEADKPDFGLALARMIAHITYLSEESIEQKFGRRLQESEAFAYDLRKETEFQIESYLHYQGRQFVERFDANSYLNLTRAMDYFDLEVARGSLGEAFAETTGRFLVVSYNTDWLFPSSQSRALARDLIRADKDVTFIDMNSAYGHDAFLIETDELGQVMTPFLERS